MSDKIISLNTEEYKLVMAALTPYRLRGFPLGRSSYSTPITWEDRKYWAELGLRVWDKFYALKEVSNE